MTNITINAKNVKEILKFFRISARYGINIVGPAGVGKVALIEKAAREISDDVIVINPMTASSYLLDESKVNGAIIILEEFNSFSKGEQEKAIQLMKKYQEETYFIAVCNTWDELDIDQFISNRLIHLKWEIKES
ncbi:hypothetical protein D3C81_94830 [compost metagenome]